MNIELVQDTMECIVSCLLIAFLLFGIVNQWRQIQATREERTEFKERQDNRDKTLNSLAEEAREAMHQYSKSLPVNRSIFTNECIICYHPFSTTEKETPVCPNCEAKAFN